MKALEILKHYVHSIVPIEYSPTFVSESIKELEYLKERILHLESIERDMIMKENKSCDNCIYSLSNIVCSNKHIHKINTNYISINKYFCCNKWENKDKITNI